jgi:hypothetical protein
MANPILMKYGGWIATLAPWAEFVTLTHRPRTTWGTLTQTGMKYHRRMVRSWFYGDAPFRGFGVLDFDPTARWWSETEFHWSGIPHEHGMLATGASAVARVGMRDAWRQVCGDLAKAQGAKFKHVYSDVGACAYVAKYTEKSASQEPRVFGFGSQDDLVTIGAELRAHPDSAWSRAAIDEVQPRLFGRYHVEVEGGVCLCPMCGLQD